MGLFDGNFSFADPNNMALLGAVAALSKAAQPSRMPVPIGSIFGSMAGGMLGGAQAGLQNELASQKVASGNLQLAQALFTENLIRQRLGMPQISLSDLQSGRSKALFANMPGQTPTPTSAPSLASSAAASPAASPVSAGTLAPGFERSATGEILRSGQNPDHFFRGFMSECQDTAGDKHPAVELDDPRRDPILGHQALGGGPLADPDRFAAAQQIARQERLADDDIADLIEAHRGGAQRRHIPPVSNRLLPAAALEVVVDDIALARFTIAGEEILESAGPQHRGLMIIEDFCDFLELDAGLLTGWSEMLIQHLPKGRALLLAAEPLDQACKSVATGHARS